MTASRRIRRHAGDDGAEEARRQARRTHFLDAAVAVIRRDGPGASMEAMAREAGVTKPILYRVFGDRDGLLLAVGGVFADNLDAELNSVLERSGDARDVLTAGIEAYLNLIENDPHLYRFLTERLAGVTHGHMGGFIEQIARSIAVTIGERLRAEGLDSGPAEPWAFGIVGMVHFAGDWWVERRTMPRERLVSYLVTLLWDGLGSLGTPTESERLDIEETSGTSGA